MSSTTIFIQKNFKINRICCKRGTSKLIKTNKLREKDLLLTDIITIATLRTYPSLPQNHPKTQPNYIKTPGKIMLEANPEVTTSRWLLT